MRECVLFLPASIRSHVVPALYLAESLLDKYDSFFAVTDQILEEIVTRQGHNALLTSSFRVALGMEQRFVQENKGKVNVWDTLKCIWNNELYDFRQRELSQIIDEICPRVIFIDIFNSTDILVLYNKYSDIKLMFLNPMLSTYRVKDFPSVNQGHWLSYRTKEVVRKSNARASLITYITRPLDGWIRKALARQFKKLTNLGGFLDKHPLAMDRTSALLFDNIPEIILAPLELELSPEVRKSNQHYIGLCVTENRQDTELDPAFDSCFDLITQRKTLGKQLVYCTFGTFYQGPDKALVSFLNRLLDAIEGIENFDAIFSVNKLVIETIKFQRKIPLHIHLFSRVPQLKVLQHADLFVTHGGLGSIKESIYYEVPMLVYPLDLHYDQNGNGLKVEHHGLGLRGVFNSERSIDMQAKIKTLISTNRFKKNLKEFKRLCMKNIQTEFIPN